MKKIKDGNKNFKRLLNGDILIEEKIEERKKKKKNKL